MGLFEREAVEIIQGNLRLYLTYLTPNDLFADGFYTVEALDPEQSAGYQRILEPSRSRRLARHLVEAKAHGYANLPTTVFLATSAPVQFDKDNSLLSFKTEEVCPFNVVDGQHRIVGLREAWEKDSTMGDFELPTTIAVNLNETDQMYHFYIVNTQQKPVDRALAQQITSRFTAMNGVSEMPYLPHWYRSQVDAGADDKALRIVERLNRDPESPLCDWVKMANDASPTGKRVAQAPLVNALKEHVISGHNLISSEMEIEKLAQIIVNYLRACKSAFVPDLERDQTVAWTGSGIWYFLLISNYVFREVYATTENFTYESQLKIIQNGLDHLDSEYDELRTQGWWKRGTGGARGLGRALWREFARGFLDALNRARGSNGRDIKI